MSLFRRILLKDASDHRGRLIAELRSRALRTDGPFTLSSGEVSEWYVDARQVTFDGLGAGIVGLAVIEALGPSVDAVGGMTMGADPIALATAMAASGSDRPLRAFSIRKEPKDHGTGGRIVGPLRPGDRVALLEDTTTTGATLLAAAEVLEAEADVELVQAIVLVDRSGGAAGASISDRGIRYTALATPADLGVAG